jgi:argininosuccinate synthase
MNAKKVALAYSGGLDTSIIIPWLKENYGCEVVAVCGDIGQGGDELTGLEAKARKTGASEVDVADMREEFVSDYLWKLVRAGGVYEHKYLLGTSSRGRCWPSAGGSRARDRMRCAGARLHRQGQRSGPFRADLQSARAAAARDRAVARMGYRFARGRIEYAAKHNVPIAQSTTKIYSRDRNIWHISHEGGALEDPANAAPDRHLDAHEESERRAR